jgi:NADH:ubiquinone oxidoreductase subunit 6 (subunit J)
LLIYVGAIAVMFLFIIIAVDPKIENQKKLLEPYTAKAIFVNNIITSFLYFFLNLSKFDAHSIGRSSDLNNFFIYKLKLENLVEQAITS